MLFFFLKENTVRMRTTALFRVYKHRRETELLIKACPILLRWVAVSPFTLLVPDISLLCPIGHRPNKLVSSKLVACRASASHHVIMLGRGTLEHPQSNRLSMGQIWGETCTSHLNSKNTTSVFVRL